VRRKIEGAAAMVLLVLFALPLYGSGTIGPIDRLGPVYPIIEPDWSTWLPKQAEKRLKERPLIFSRDQIRDAINWKMPKTNFPEVKVSRRYTVDPSVQVGLPVTDQTGKIVISAGARVNPLEHLPFFRPIVIIDATKKKQVEWATGIQGSPLVLITTGDVLELSRRFGRQIYPAPSALIERFAIERVPVMLSYKNGMLEVEEVVLQ
jgi:conjugal transfer pilus assembly protein TraW